MKKAKIAIIEDEVIIAKDLEFMLENARYEISGVFTNAEEAITQFQIIRPDIVLIDVTLKGKLDGIEAGKYIQDSFSIPLIYLTANSDEMTLSKIKRSGPDGYFVKPYEEEHLKAAIDSTLRNHRNSIDNTNRQCSSSTASNLSHDSIYRNPDAEQFIYAASHDLQEPLRMIASYVQLLQKRYKGKLDPEADDFINFAVDGVNRMKRMIDGLLTYSRLTSRSSQKELTNLDRVVYQIVEKIRNEFNHQNQVITWSELPELMANTEQMSLLFANLIHNSVKFNKSDAPRVEITCRKNDGYWHFAVKDNGIGIEDQYSDKIFNIFQKLHGQREYDGTGIGLAICRKISELHDGRIWFESKPGEGTTFFFTIKRS